jgi:hypothetical protein
MTKDQEKLRSGLTEGTLNRAGYATGVFDAANLTPGTNQIYKVQAYDMRQADPARREKEHLVEAQSAEHAIHVVSKRRTFAFTRKDQASDDAATRDNAHHQVDPSHGFVGFIAWRA